MPRIQLEKTKSGKVIGGDGKPILGGFKREARLEVGEYLVKITQLGAKTTKKGPMLILEGTLEASIPEDAAHAAVLVQGKKIAQTFMGFDYEKMAAQICFAADGLTWDEGVEQTEEEINAQLRVPTWSTSTRRFPRRRPSRAGSWRRSRGAATRRRTKTGRRSSAPTRSRSPGGST
jgi:hypothetical protein